MYLLALIVPSEMCKLLMPWALTHLIPPQMLAFELGAHNNPDSFPLWPGSHDVHDFQIHFEMWTIRPQHTFPLCVIPSQMSSGPENPGANWVLLMYGLCFCMVEF
ncbi:hypothetical protein XENOCAPTIV_014087 [Xenoophorus captivus]|uniref:Uncharacterized protein n=1 Tax=Xenoophorus captivus TaxID=1517983 RepID=A0ABV0QRT7_9TELE